MKTNKTLELWLSTGPKISEPLINLFILAHFAQGDNPYRDYR